LLDVEVRFRTRQLARRYERSAEAIRAWGPDVGPRYVARVSDLRSADSLQDLYALRRLGFHPLTGDRRGRFAVRLTGQVRLVLSFEDETIVVEEVVDYHD
jgi:proteic killer suppression protein